MPIQVISSGDGVKLALHTFEPDAPAQASVVIAAAMGVSQSYYSAFASWLATQGLRVTTFDYRGSGESQPNTRHGGLRGFKADLFDWARDYEAVIDHAHAALPNQPLYLLGHSLGGQLPGMIRNQHKVHGLLGVGAGSGYWRHNAPPLKRMVPFFWWVAVPLATRLCGYFPGRRLGMVGDLPRGVILQWRRWCLNPRYSAGAEGSAVAQAYAATRFPVHSMFITDDEMMTVQGTQALLDLYSQAPRSLETITPQDGSARRVGHFGFFREQFSQTLWPRALARLHGFARAADVPVT